MHPGKRVRAGSRGLRKLSRRAMSGILALPHSPVGCHINEGVVVTDTVREHPPARPSQDEGMGTGVDTALVARAARLIPLIREHAERTSEQRRVVPEVMTAMEQAELFRLFVPKRHGG